MPDTLSEAVFHALVEEAPDAIVLVDRYGSIVFVNVRAIELFGYTREELVGQRVELLIPDQRRSMHVIHREIYVEHPTLRPMGAGLDLSGLRKDGTTFPVEISLSSIGEGNALLSVAAVRDVTRQRRAEEALRRSEERHRLLNERSEGIVFRYRLGSSPGFEYISSSVGRALGYAPEEFYVDEDLIFTVTESEDRDLLREVLRGDTPTAIVRLLTRSGEAHWFDWRTVRVSGADGVVVALEGTARDITERRRADAERASLEAEVELEAERRRIAGDLHDDTIQSVYALGLGLHAARDDESMTRDLIIDRTIEGLDAIITALRTYMQQLSGERAAVMVTTLASRIAALIDAGGSTQWTLDIDRDLPFDTAFDRQVFLLAKELISNVQRHARASTARLKLGRDEAGRVLLEVSDDGVGFDQGRVAESSFGLRSLQLRAGTLGAELTIESAEGTGTRIVVAIPTPSPPEETRVE